MKKQTKKILVVLAVLIAIISLILISGKIKMPFVTVPLSSDLGNCLGGWTSFSIDKVDIVGEGQRFRIFGVAKGSECLQISLTKEQLNNYLKGDYEATKPLYGSIKLLEYTKTFPIDPTGNCYRNIADNIVVDGTRENFATIDNCKKWGYANTIYAYRPVVLYNVRCVITGCNGNEGGFQSSRSYGDFKVEFKLGDKSEILSRAKQSATLKNGNIFFGDEASIEWVGNLNNLDEIYPPQYKAKLVGSKWYLIRDESYSLIENKISNFVTCLNLKKASGYLSDGSFDYCKSIFDNEVIPILEDKTPTYERDMSNLIFDANTDNNALYVSLRASPLPAFILDVDAEWVGIVPLKGQPEITSCIILNQDLKSGTPKTVNFRIKNDANVNAEFYGSIICDKGAVGYISNFQIGKNEEKTMTAELIPSAPTQDVSGTCTLQITDLKSKDYDSCTFGINVDYVSGVICQAGTKKCSDDMKKLGTCKSDGSDYDYSACEKGCEYYAGSARCIGIICKKEKESCSTVADCCEKLSCENKICVKEETKDCKSCTDWAKNFFRKDENKCKTDLAIKFDTKWYNPFSWLGGIINLTGITSQNIVCPIVISLGILVLIVFLLIVLIVLSLLGITIFTFKGIINLFRKKKKR